MTLRLEHEPMPQSDCVCLGQDLCATVLHVVNRSWTSVVSRGRVSPNMYEVPITERLRDAMRSYVNEHFFRQITVRAGTETRSSPEVLNPDGRTDISVFMPDLLEKWPNEHDHHAIIECKRIAGDDSKLCGRFVADGVDRFASGQYGVRHATGFMAGYVLRGEVDSVCTAINRYLSRNNRASEHLRPCEILPARWTRSSRHPRPPPVPGIDLHHAFLTFRAA